MRIKGKDIFHGSIVKISTRGERHLDAVIGSDDFERGHCQILGQQMDTMITLLSKIASSSLHVFHQWLSMNNHTIVELTKKELHGEKTALKIKIERLRQTKRNSLD